ncbi:MAG: riboflavin biosynthesis protein RibF [Lentisphaerae bacterium GWF2_50_93]|nr:MAG: riboflavin biosynthesis protein RibF [Lentisphaerae bacterium GWF2_50_93]
MESLVQHGIKRVSVAIGVFDGVHLGHQQLLKELLKIARETDSVPAVLTFYPHPRQVLNPKEPPLLIVSQEKKIQIINEFGIRTVITFPFTREFANDDAETFLQDCLYSPDVKLCGICVGKKWRFGAGGKGNIHTLDKFANNQGIRFSAVEELLMDGHPVSSTSIRRAVTGGLLDAANKMLGRPYSLSGKVEHGENIGTKVLDCPTANLSVSHGIIPPRGVYAGYAVFGGARYPAAISIGTAPTFKHKNPSNLLIEAHLMDGFAEMIYGRPLEIEFLKYIRAELCFSSVETLKWQIKSDIEKIREILKKEKKQ